MPNRYIIDFLKILQSQLDVSRLDSICARAIE